MSALDDKMREAFVRGLVDDVLVWPSGQVGRATALVWEPSSNTFRVVNYDESSRVKLTLAGALASEPRDELRGAAQESAS